MHRLLLLLGGSLAVPCVLSASVAGEQPTADSVLEQLLQGNKRFVSGEASHPHCDAARRTEVAGGQKPPAIILACADSRVAPELVFDQGLGDLFVVRVAGNVIDNIALGSLEYAAEHLGSRLIIVLGHEKCGAVSAAVSGGHAPGHIHSIVEAIVPAVAATADKPGDKVDNTVRANASAIARSLRESGPILRELVAKGALRVIAARYDLDSGEVEILP